MSPPAAVEATLFRGSRALRIRVSEAWYRLRCGRRFGHFPMPDEYGHPSCGRCNARLM